MPSVRVTVPYSCGGLQVKLLDENKRLFGVLNPVDLVAVLLAIALVVVLATVLFGGGPAAPVTSRDEVDVEMVLEGPIGEFDEVQYAVGQELSRVGGLGLMGTVTDIEVGPAEREVYDAEGKPVVATSPTTRTLTITVRGKGQITDSAASIGSEKVRQNQVFDAQLPYFQVTVRVMSIKQVDE
ncbi:DUF4330 domain-containing protein [bacterium]|nr:DUF4330 domain-containing protein [bacterium]